MYKTIFSHIWNVYLLRISHKPLLHWPTETDVELPPVYRCNALKIVFSTITLIILYLFDWQCMEKVCYIFLLKLLVYMCKVRVPWMENEQVLKLLWFHEARFQPLSCKNFLTKIVIVLHFVKKSCLSWALRCPSSATCCFVMNLISIFRKDQSSITTFKEFEEFLCILRAQQFAPVVSCFGNGCSLRCHHLTTCACGWHQICYQNQSSFVNESSPPSKMFVTVPWLYFVSDLHLYYAVSSTVICYLSFSNQLHSMWRFSLI